LLLWNCKTGRAGMREELRKTEAAAWEAQEKAIGQPMKVDLPFRYGRCNPPSREIAGDWQKGQSHSMEGTDE